MSSIVWWNDAVCRTSFYAQYKCMGPGARESGRVPWSYKLTDEDVQQFLQLDFIEGATWLQLTWDKSYHFLWETKSWSFSCDAIWQQGLHSKCVYHLMRSFCLQTRPLEIWPSHRQISCGGDKGIRTLSGLRKHAHVYKSFTNHDDNLGSQQYDTANGVTGTKVIYTAFLKRVFESRWPYVLSETLC